MACGATSRSVIPLTVETDGVLCQPPTIRLCLKYNGAIVGRPEIWWGEGDVSAVTCVPEGQVTWGGGAASLHGNEDVLLGLAAETNIRSEDRGGEAVGYKTLLLRCSNTELLSWDACATHPVLFHSTHGRSTYVGRKMRTDDGNQTRECLTL